MGAVFAHEGDLGVRQPFDRTGVKALAVVLDEQPYTAVFEANLDIDACRVAMTERVADRLLADTEQVVRLDSRGPSSAACRFGRPTELLSPGRGCKTVLPSGALLLRFWKGFTLLARQARPRSGRHPVFRRSAAYFSVEMSAVIPSSEVQVRPPGDNVSLERAAQLLGVCRRTIYYWIGRGRLQTIRTIGGSQRVLLDSIAQIDRQAS